MYVSDEPKTKSIENTLGKSVRYQVIPTFINFVHSKPEAGQKTPEFFVYRSSNEK